MLAQSPSRCDIGLLLYLTLIPGVLLTAIDLATARALLPHRRALFTPHLHTRPNHRQ